MTTEACESIATVFSEKLHYYRRDKGWSQVELSKRSGVSNHQISKIEKGVVNNASISTLAALASALEVTTDQLLGRA